MPTSGTSLELPSYDVIEQLHRKYAPSEAAFDLVFTHCQIIGETALQLANQPNVTADRELVLAGSLLHDIGVYSLFNNDGSLNHQLYISHGVRGEEILKQEGFPETLYRFASHHTGAGITKKQIIEQKLPLPPHDYLAETTEEELVMYADKFHSKTEPPCFNSFDYYAHYVQRFGEDSVKNFMALSQKFGKPNLAPLIAQFGHSLRED